MIRVIGLGAGGHAKVVIEILRLAGQYELVGLLDADPARQGESVEGVPVIGDDSQLGSLYEEGVRYAFIGLGSAGDLAPRRRLYEKVRSLGFEVVRAIHPKAVIAASAQLGQGATVMAGAIINPAARLGDNVIVNTGAIVEHDCVLEDHVHLATGARLAGKVHVGQGSHIGIGASVRQGIHIGRESVVGAGTVVVDDVPERVVVVGAPAKILRKVES